jgi:hypothetical protein
MGMNGSTRDAGRRTDHLRMVDPVDQRAHRRSPAMMTAWLRLDDDEEGPQEVRIRNLSDRGLMAEPGYPVAAGTRAVLTLPGVGEVSGRVAWYAEGRIGVALDAVIDPEQVQRAVAGE